MPVGAAGEVAAVYSRYSFGVDNRRADVIEACFTPETLFGLAGQPPMVGHKAIAARLMHLADPAVVHHAFNIVVLEEMPDGVVARADFTMAKNGVVIATGHYDDSLARSPGLTWVFTRRTITYTWRASTE
jgi:hypothetical protein